MVRRPSFVVPGLAPGIHDFDIEEDVDGPHKPGHDAMKAMVV